MYIYIAFHFRRLLKSEAFCTQCRIKRAPYQQGQKSIFTLHTFDPYCYMHVRYGWGISTCKTNWSSIEAVQNITLRIVLGMLDCVSTRTVLNAGRPLSIFDGLKKCNFSFVSNKQSKIDIQNRFGSRDSVRPGTESRAQTAVARAQSDVKAVGLTSCRWFFVAGERGVAEAIPATKTSTGADDHYAGTALAAGHGHGGERGRAGPVRGRVIASAMDGRQRESTAPARQPGGAFAR